MTIGEKIIAEIRKLAEEKPDFIYQRAAGASRCQYMHGEQPGCIVGQALWRLGLIDASLENAVMRITGMDAAVNTVGSTDLLHYLDISLPTRQLAWIRNVQWEQDNGKTWAEAVAYADRHFDVEES